MIVFVNLPGSRLDTILAGMRRNKIGPIPHKAILTQTNQHWNVLQCFKEIDAEHKAMTESSSLSDVSGFLFCRNFVLPDIKYLSAFCRHLCLPEQFKTDFHTIFYKIHFFEVILRDFPVR